MSLNESMSRVVRDLTQQVAKEENTEQLRELVLAINSLLTAIERQRAKLEGGSPRPH